MGETCRALPALVSLHGIPIDIPPCSVGVTHASTITSGVPAFQDVGALHRVYIMIHERLTPSRLLGLALLLCWLALPSPSLHAGTLQNLDPETYQYAVHWEDLEPVTKGEIFPGETVELRNATAYIELVGKRDNIYKRPDESILIQGGVLRSPSNPIED